MRPVFHIAVGGGVVLLPITTHVAATGSVVKNILLCGNLIVRTARRWCRGGRRAGQGSVVLHRPVADTLQHALQDCIKVSTNTLHDDGRGRHVGKPCLAVGHFHLCCVRAVCIYFLNLIHIAAATSLGNLVDDILQRGYLCRDTVIGSCRGGRYSTERRAIKVGFQVQPIRRIFLREKQRVRLCARIDICGIGFLTQRVFYRLQNRVQIHASDVHVRPAHARQVHGLIDYGQRLIVVAVDNLNDVGFATAPTASGDIVSDKSHRGNARACGVLCRGGRCRCAGQSGACKVGFLCESLHKCLAALRRAQHVTEQGIGQLHALACNRKRVPVPVLDDGNGVEFADCHGRCKPLLAIPKEESDSAALQLVAAEVGIYPRLLCHIEHFVVGCSGVCRRRGLACHLRILSESGDHRQQYILQYVAGNLVATVLLYRFRYRGFQFVPHDYSLLKSLLKSLL